MKQISVLPLCVLMAVMTGCFSEKDASEVILLVEQSAETLQEGEYVRFSVEAWTNNSSLTTFRVWSYDVYNGQSELLSEELDEKRFTGEYIFTAPATDSELMTVEYNFEVSDDAGNTQKVIRYLSVTAKDIKDEILDEAATSVMMYSPDSGKPDGFSLTTLQTLYVEAAEDDQVDIYIPQNPDSDEMSRYWMSKSGISFAKMSGVDYSTITQSGLVSLYDIANKSNMASDISLGDVILVGTDTSVIGIILVTGVYDNEGTASDYYMFNIKLL